MKPEDYYTKQVEVPKSYKEQPIKMSATYWKCTNCGASKTWYSDSPPPNDGCRPAGHFHNWVRQ